MTEVNRDDMESLPSPESRIRGMRSLVGSLIGAYGEFSNRRSPIPTWLQAGLFVLALIAIASGVSIAFLKPDYVTLVVILLIFGGVLISILLKLDSPSAFDKYAEQIRNRVDNESTTMHFNVQEGGYVQVGSVEQDAATMRASDSLEKQEVILREIYTQGMAQAKVSFRVSIFFASIGSAFLMLGIGLAIYHADTNGEKYASVVAGTAGVVINLTASVFFVQSNRARKSMGEQGVLLREESQEDRRLNAARELTGSINDESLKNEVRAKLALTLLGAEGGLTTANSAKSEATK